MAHKQTRYLCKDDSAAYYFPASSDPSLNVPAPEDAWEFCLCLSTDEAMMFLWLMQIPYLSNFVQFDETVWQTLYRKVVENMCQSLTIEIKPTIEVDFNTNVSINFPFTKTSTDDGNGNVTDTLGIEVPQWVDDLLPTLPVFESLPLLTDASATELAIEIIPLLV